MKGFVTEQQGPAMQGVAVAELSPLEQLWRQFGNPGGCERRICLVCWQRMRIRPQLPSLPRTGVHCTFWLVYLQAESGCFGWSLD